MISEKTLLENHPWVKNTEQEIRNIESDNKKKMDQEIELQEKTAQITKKYSNTSSTTSIGNKT